MNLGIEDATLLASAIAEGGLQEYATERHRAGASAIRMIKVQTRLATSTSPFLRVVRNYLLPFLLRREVIHQRLIKRMVGLSGPN